ncbi:MAG: DNA polymerase IV, partial [Lachnospiraceae bacterium]|nr:DNA polymerase IV [Lachnospiraceae bacterium]
AAVGGDVKSRHGIITAKSIPAKAYGIVTGEPVVSARTKCPDLKLIPGDYALYHRMSEAFMEICRIYSPTVEQFSVDECFLDLTNIIRDEEEAVRTANALRERIKTELGFTVNIGVAENKLLAKTASDFKKPDRVHTLWTEEIPAKFWTLPVRDLLFVGASSAERLKTLGIRTIGELAATPESVLYAHFGEKGGRSLHRSSNGLDDSPVVSSYGDAQSYGHSTTLPYDYTDMEEIRPVLLKLAEKASYRMRRDGKKAGLVTVSYKSNDFRTFSRQKKLDYVTNASEILYREAVPLFEALWDHRTPIRLLGVSLGDVTDGENEQFSLFGQEERAKQEKLDEMMDSIRDKYGKESIRRGGKR